jgi:alanyl-tRNA synthetase
MTERLYYDDPYLTRFSASVTEKLQWHGDPAVVLDRSAFYPTGGGQPHDTGLLGNAVVIDVVEREPDATVVHVLSQPLEVADVEGSIDWKRRFDLMQQHTGQHILSAAFVEILEANTVGFHLSQEYATLDLDRVPLASDDLNRVEDLANAIVVENRSVSTRFVLDEELPLLALRKPLAHEGPVRIVNVGGASPGGPFDSSACGGTHVRRTGEVGPIKITRSERRGAETRVEFLCGGRALADYRAKNAMVMELAQEFTVGHWELPDAVHRLSDELRETRRALRRSRDSLLEAEATALWHQAEVLTVGETGSGSTVETVHIVRGAYDGRSMDDLKHLAQRLIVHPCTVALLASRGQGDQKSYLTFARSDDLDVNMGTLVRPACEIIGGRGGGRPNFAQGGGAEAGLVGQALDGARETLFEQLS